MDDQFDNELKDHIRKVFDEFEDPSADEGWLLLREKFPAQAKRRAIAWLWWSAAAIALLFLSVALWKYTAQVGPNKLIAKKEVTTPNKNMAATKTGGNSIAAAKPDSSTPIIKSVPPNHIASAPLNPAKLSEDKTNNSLAAKHPATAPLNKPDVIVSTADILRPTTQQNTVATNATQPANSPVLPNASQPQKPIAIVKPGKSSPAANQPPANQLAANTNSTTTTTTTASRPKSIENMLANNPEPRKRGDDLGPRVRFGVFAGTYVNYSKGSGNQRNVGGGFSSDIRITKHLKLVTGVAITQNSLSFNTSLPFGPQPSSFNTPGVAMGAAASAYDAKSAVTVATMPAFKNYGANMVGLDIPLNLQYDFNPKKNNFYVMAGLSSGTFINETYTYKYNYPALASATLQQIQNETSRKTFDSFYFGKTLNLAFGVAAPIGGHRIILEPFVKYPLDGLGAQNLKFGSGGVNLKFNFATGKR